MLFMLRGGARRLRSNGCVKERKGTALTPSPSCLYLRANLFHVRCPSLAFQVACNHKREILHVAGSFFGALNDKTIARHDDNITRLHDGSILQDFTYKLFSADGQQKTYRGPYYLCDGGYHRWPCLMSPVVGTQSDDEFLYSEWLESMRKDVECVFGILKGRFRCTRSLARLSLFVFSMNCLLFVHVTCMRQNLKNRFPHSRSGRV